MLVLRAELVAKDFGLANEQAFWTFLPMLVSLRATLRAHTVCCASRSTVTEPFEGLTRQLHNFLSKKKKKEPLANRKFEEPSALKRKILQEHTTGELERLTKDGRASLFSHSEVYEQGRALVRMPCL